MMAGASFKDDLDIFLNEYVTSIKILHAKENKSLLSKDFFNIKGALKSKLPHQILNALKQLKKLGPVSGLSIRFIFVTILLLYILHLISILH